MCKQMCDCHRWPEPVREAIRVTEREENTRADWEDLHDTIEQYRRRRAIRHVAAHVSARSVDEGLAK
jgi:hypothetical protein